MSNNTYEKLSWIIIDKYFKDNPELFVRHHLDSYNDFINNNIYNIFREKNPIKILKNQDPNTKEYNLQAEIFIGGLDGSKIYFGKPIIYDETRTHYMYPNEARLRNMTYGYTLHVDVLVKYKIKLDESEKEFNESETLLEKIYFGKFPIMLNSDLCILNKLDKNLKFNMGECKNDYGGYFIIDGKEKVIISQEKFADNMIYIKSDYNEIYSHTCEIRSVSEDSSKPIRTLSIRIMRSSTKYTNNQIVVNVPNVRKPVPLFILMRALGINSDKSIIQYCLLDMKKYNDYIDLFIPSIHDAGGIFNQELALKYIATLTKGKTIVHVMEILMDYLLPHIGENNFNNKAYFLGFMVHKLLKVYKNHEEPTDRDNFKYKRVELTGSLIYDLFKEYYSLQQKHIFQKIDKEYYYKQGIYENDFKSLIENNYLDFFKERILESGFKKAFKGSWGAEEHTRRPEVIQDLNRLSYNSYLSHLRKLNLPLDSSAKVVGPRLLHSSQWGIIDPVDTPDGGNVGLHKHMSLGAYISSGFSKNSMFELLKNLIFIELLDETNINYIAQTTKIFINGAWVGIVNNPSDSLNLLITYRRLGLLPIYTSISWSINENIIYIYTDSGRLTRPVYYVNNNIPSFKNDFIEKTINSKEFNFYQLLIGFNKIKDSQLKQYNYLDFIKKNKIYTIIEELYDANDIENIDNINIENNQKKLEKLIEKCGIIEYMDSSESETSLIACDEESIQKYTSHLEIHNSLILGIMGNQIVFPENNQLPRDLFSCGQSKQAVSLYHTNYQNRIDKMGVVLNNGQLPLVKSRYLNYINNEEHPYGINAIVAIGCYGGYNVEDSILFNEGSIKRGMFNTTYFNSYESYEQSSKVSGSNTDSNFINIENNIIYNKKPGYDYSMLDNNGLIKENTVLDDKKVIIGKATNNDTKYIDSSVFPKKGQLGFVDKSFITDGEEGYRIAKVRIREQRIPAIGDKFCSRCGQKGTVGLIIPEENMPFTEEGIRPDLIINPHALPSRMTIGQLVETLMGKACSLVGGFGDCTAFVNKGSKHYAFGKLLKEIGYNSTGNEILYNGETGEQLKMELFIGPCYYMRLKHMVKDKINYRARGPRTVLTRQTVQGRANDGGLRVGEMERDCIIAHGASYFLQESMLNRGDEYYVAICNNSGTIAIYNESKKIFISPFSDGPLIFNTNIEDNQNIEVVTQFGRSFSIIKVPYAFKLLLQELQVMNIQMRIITDANVDQLTSLNHNNTLKVLNKFYDKTKETKEKERVEGKEGVEGVEGVEDEDKTTTSKSKIITKDLADVNLGDKDKKVKDEEDSDKSYSEISENDTPSERMRKINYQSIKKAEAAALEQNSDISSDESENLENKPILTQIEELSDTAKKSFESFVTKLTQNPPEKQGEGAETQGKGAEKQDKGAETQGEGAEKQGEGAETQGEGAEKQDEGAEKQGVEGIKGGNKEISILEREEDNINLENDENNENNEAGKLNDANTGGMKKSISFNI